ncbi:hypothetical protein VSH64_32380 [Amycolatopsis rhabdoformis]|uniref:HAF repeat-containing protein n=1 Tax=Amycolatopsis rhabdoformis TaxID=1448059 RepID=A0ABZ1I1J5_9PSEU|nr:hypothetical protein [Amycolatopsis rhabdoformis]WSE27529.1 hypothetical protein VSH64_32380 [Amycolatopsis rhabdoformis]
MKVSRRAFAAGVAAVAVTALAPAVATAAPAAPIELAPRAGDTYTGVEAMNDRGTVVGESYPRDVRILYHPMKWSASGSATALPTLGGQLGHAVAVNQSDVVVGVADDAAGVSRAVRWAADGSVTQLTASGESSSASAIADTGRIVGSYYDGTALHPLVWERDGTARELPGLPGGGSTSVNEITLDGRFAAGLADDADGRAHLVRWDLSSGGITNLTAAVAYGTITGISRDGAITGSVTETVGGNTVFKRWDLSGHVVTLGGTEAPSFGEALGVGENGVVVGLVDPDFGGSYATRWDSAGHPTSLPSDTRNAKARAINRIGTIVGQAESVGAKWSPNGSRSRLEPLPGHTSADALLVNSRGVAAGMSYGDVWRGVIWK